MSSSVNKNIDVNKFSESFGADVSDIHEICGDLIIHKNFEYSICNTKEKVKIIAQIREECNNSTFSVSGKDRKNDWKVGWNENLKAFIESNYDLVSLIPRYIKHDRPLRLNGNYVVPKSGSFEQDYSSIFRQWLFTKYLSDYENIYEYGCGTGVHLSFLAKLFENKKYIGLDWAEASQKILSLMNQAYSWDIEGFQFDFFKPDYNITILPNSAVLTFGALEQVGSNYDKFIEYLLKMKPRICINVECFNELYDDRDEFDRVAIQYHLSRNYLHNYTLYLKNLENEGKVRIHKIKRLNFGSLYHEVYSYIIWQIISND